MALAVSLALLAGCSSHREVDNLSGPSGPYDPTLSEQNRAQLIGTSSLEIITELLASIPDWAQGRFVGFESAGGRTDSVYDPQQQAWTFTDSLNLSTTDPPTWTRHLYTYAVRYERNRNPQPDYRTADGMYLRILQDQTGHAESAAGDPNRYTMDYAYRYTVTGDVSNLPALPFGYNGAGGLQGSVSIISAGTTKVFSYSATYYCNLQLGADGCPTGNVNITIAPYSMAAQYQGSAQVAWSLVRGMSTVAQGTSPARCWQRRADSRRPDRRVEGGSGVGGRRAGGAGPDAVLLAVGGATTSPSAPGGPCGSLWGHGGGLAGAVSGNPLAIPGVNV